jgi:hypothetical protein
MLANSWRSFRSYPWATIYPALAFLTAIVTFTLLGEGLRRLSEELTLSMKALFNRYTFLVACLVAGIVVWTIQSTGIWAERKPMAETFDAQRVLADVEVLAGSEFGGRQVGTAGADAAADWIAAQFENMGLITAGEHWTYFQTIRTRIASMTGEATLEASDANGRPLQFALGVDFAEAAELSARQAAGAQGDIVYVSASFSAPEPSVSAVRAAIGLSDDEASRTGRVLLLEYDDSWLSTSRWIYVPTQVDMYVGAAAALIITDEPSAMLKRELPGISMGSSTPVERPMPVLFITAETARRILAGSGSTLAELRDRREALEEGQGFLFATGARAQATFPAIEQKDITYRNVMAMWPGEDVELDAEMLIVTAHYDGLGSAYGRLYPGANDNASGVATMLEIIRSWKEWNFRPKRTVLFVAWMGGELHQTPAIWNYLGARSSLSLFDVLGAFEVSGVGAGTGDAVLAWRSSSDRMTELIQTAGRRLRIPVATVGKGLHAASLLSQPLLANYAMITVSWPGADANTHLPTDTPGSLDTEKIRKAGQLLSLAMAVMATDTAH